MVIEPAITAGRLEGKKSVSVVGKRWKSGSRWLKKSNKNSDIVIFINIKCQ